MIKLKVEKVDLYSNILEKEMSMLVYLPTTYNHLNSLPVLYFLHQRRGDENIMFEIDIHTTADKLIETGKIELRSMSGTLIFQILKLDFYFFEVFLP